MTLKRRELLDDKKVLIGIHSTNGNSAPNWTPEKYRELILKLKSNENFKIVVTDIDIPKEIRRNQRGLLSESNMSLRDWFIYFASFDLLISSSTGPMHVTAALKVKTLSLFCPLTGMLT